MKARSSLRIGVASVFLLSILFFTGTPAIAQFLPCFDENGTEVDCGGPGDVRLNGTGTQPTYIRTQDLPAAGVPSNFFSTPGFLFEPESPYASLKTVPTWNELEQLLDNPYAVTADTVTPGNFDGYPSYKSTITRRPNLTAGTSLLSPGTALPAFNVHPLNYNPPTGEEMRLLNSEYRGSLGGNALGRLWFSPNQLIHPFPNFLPNLWAWTFRMITVSRGDQGRVTDTEIDYNGPHRMDPFLCVTNLELVPPEGTTLCGMDPGEPGYAGFGVLNGVLTRPRQYSTPALSGGPTSPGTFISTTARLFDPTRGIIQARSTSTGAGGLRKPSLRVPEAGGTPSSPNYLLNTNANNTTPSNENDYYRQSIGTTATATAGPIPNGRNTAIALGKAMFWDMQVGSDGVQSCGTCHFNGTGTDTRTKNQVNPNHLGGDTTFQIHGGFPPNTYDLVASDFPTHKVANIDMAGDPACTTPIVANVTNVTPALDHPVSGNVTVCSDSNIQSDVNDVVSSMGVVFNKFSDIAPIGLFQPAAPLHPAAVMPDLRVGGGANQTDPILGFQGLRRVEPRNTPTMQAAGFNFDNFWDGRARHDFNGGSVFGAADPQKHVWVNDGSTGGSLTATRQLIKFASIASLATGPGLSEFEMSFLGRNWAKIGKKLLQAGVTPLANQLVDPTDSVMGPFSGQRTLYNGPVDRPGRPGLNVSYEELIKAAYFPKLWANTSQHLNGCYTDGDAILHPNQCAPGSVVIPVLSNGAVVNSSADPFDGFVLQGPVAPAALASDTNQFRQIEANWSLFWGLSIHAWVQILVPDDTPFDKFLDKNPDAFLSLADTSEVGLVDDLLKCTTTTQRNCFREYGPFKRDPGLVAYTDCQGEGGTNCVQHTNQGGTRNPATDPDPLLGADIFFASNLSLKNRTFRSARCGACHNLPTLTDHTMPFTFKAQLPDFASEFSPTNPGVELLTEPLGRARLISGFLLESEIAENGQDGIERRFINQSIAPNPDDGIAYPDGVFNPPSYKGSGQAFIDNGVYNIGVRPINNDIGRGGTDAFGWPLSLATLMLKNLGGTDFEPGNPIDDFDPSIGPDGGMFEETAQDQQINPGVGGEPQDPQLPAYLAPFANEINVGDAQPDIDELNAGINTLTNVAMLEGFLDNIGPINPAAIKNEALNNGQSELEGTWPDPNRVIRDGAFKAPQLRNVELTGPYFHNGGQLTLRQVVDFYTRGGDFPISNAAHRDFLLVNMNIEAQSNLNGTEKVALVDFLLALTDERNRYDRAPFDHPEVIVPFDGLAPDNLAGRTALLANPMFKDIVAVGSAGQATPEPAFLNVRSDDRNSPHCSSSAGPVSHYCSVITP
jgi:cytochrome c peroxidase